ncbi:hypothetical protein L9F63_017458, partial [Diploptera punctata]
EGSYFSRAMVPPEDVNRMPELTSKTAQDNTKTHTQDGDLKFPVTRIRTRIARVEVCDVRLTSTQLTGTQGLDRPNSIYRCSPETTLLQVHIQLSDSFSHIMSMPCVMIGDIAVSNNVMVIVLVAAAVFS